MDVAKSDTAFHENMKDLVDEKVTKGNEDVIFVNLPKIDDPKKFIFETKDTMKLFDSKFAKSKLPLVLKCYTNFRQKTLNSVNFLIKEFEMRKAADEHKRTLTAKSGDLNLAKLHAYKYAEDLFKRSDVITEGKSHGLVMLLDMSTSMRAIFHDTVVQLLVLVEFCRRIGIPFDVYGFTNQGAAKTAVRDRRGPIVLNEKDNDVQIGYLQNGCVFIQLIDSNLSANDYRKQMGCLLNWSMRMTFGPRAAGAIAEYDIEGVNLASSDILTLCGTPLIEAMYIMPNIIKKFKERTGVQIVHFFNLTDGYGGNISAYKKTTPGAGSYGRQTQDLYLKESGEARSRIVINDLQFKQIYDYKFDKEQKKSLVDYSGQYAFSMNLLSKRIQNLGCRVININLVVGTDAYHFNEPFNRAHASNTFFKKETKKKVEHGNPLVSFQEIGFYAMESTLYSNEFIVKASNPDVSTAWFSEKKYIGGETVEQLSADLKKVMSNNLNGRMIAVEFSKLIAL
jgi:hypothetical protein